MNIKLNKIIKFTKSNLFNLHNNIFKYQKLAHLPISNYKRNFFKNTKKVQNIKIKYIPYKLINITRKTTPLPIIRYQKNNYHNDKIDRNIRLYVIGCLITMGTLISWLIIYECDDSVYSYTFAILLSFIWPIYWLIATIILISTFFAYLARIRKSALK